MTRGPHLAYVEHPLEATAEWNFLTNPELDTTTSWTLAGAGATVATVATGSHDLLIPKYTTNCTKVSVPLNTVTTYSQAVAAMSTDVTAANAAGRRVTAGGWVYSRVAARVSAQIIDDGTTTSSSLHGGTGWELLTVSANIAGDNATTLTFRINVTSGAAMTYFANRAWFFYGDQMPNYWDEENPIYVRRDDTTQRLILPHRIEGKRQLRLVGTDHLDLLGTTNSTRITNEMEISEAQGELLSAEAAKILFGWDMLKSPGFEEVLWRVKNAESRKSELASHLKINMPANRIQGPYD